MKFVLRVDDCGWDSDKRHDLGLAIMQRFHSAMNGLPWLGAVIPSALDHDGLAWLQSMPSGLTVALHGWNHRKSDDGVESEFRNMELRGMRQRITWAWNAMKDVPCRDMVLPFNAYEPDLNEACYLEGIYRIWGGAGHDRTTPSRWPTPPQPYSLGRIAFVPSWSLTYGATFWRMSPEDVPLCETLPQLLDLPGRSVLTVHITWEAAKSEKLDGVKWIASKIGDHLITADEYFA